jgi:hypothetical protein
VELLPRKGVGETQEGAREIERRAGRREKGGVAEARPVEGRDLEPEVCGGGREKEPLNA